MYLFLVVMTHWNKLGFHLFDDKLQGEQECDPQREK